LDGKVALVTGGARGLGEATCRRFASEGAKVIITDINVENGQKLAREIGDSAIFIEHDVALEDSWRRAIAAGLEAFGKLNIVVNNAGLSKIGTIETVTEADWRLQQAVMVDGVFYGCKHGLTAIKSSGEMGSIINLASVVAVNGYPIYFAYAACKGAVCSMTRSIAVHCLRSGYPIRVNTVLPGGLLTPMGDDLIEQVRQLGGDVNLEPPTGPRSQPGTGQASPLLGAAEDAALLNVFLASDESRHINGAEHVIDGGRLIIPGQL
jgi:3(or 17)beta-hydroxysteroid dehydrogenase